MSTLSYEEWQQLCEIMNGYIYSQTLATACDFDIFTYLSKHPGATIEQLQEALSLSRYSARILLLACCAVGLIRRDEHTGEYFNSIIADKILVTDSSTCMIPFVQFNHKVQQRCSIHLTSALKEQRNAGLDEFPGDGDTLYQRLTGYPEFEQLFQAAMGAYTRLSPKMINVSEFSEVKHILDIGGGNGTNAIRLCQNHPSLKVTIAETPTVCEIARKFIKEHNMSDRVFCVECDVFKEPWPKNCDGVLMSHFVEIFSEEKIGFLYKRAFEILPDNGMLFVWTIMANDLETKGLQAAKSSSYFLSTASGEGMAYPSKDHKRWLCEVGFREVRHYDVSEIDHGVLVAVK